MKNRKNGMISLIIGFMLAFGFIACDNGGSDGNGGGGTGPIDDPSSDSKDPSSSSYVLDLSSSSQGGQGTSSNGKDPSSSSSYEVIELSSSSALVISSSSSSSSSSGTTISSSSSSVTLPQCTFPWQVPGQDCTPGQSSSSSSHPSSSSSIIDILSSSSSEAADIWKWIEELDSEETNGIAQSTPEQKTAWGIPTENNNNSILAAYGVACNTPSSYPSLPQAKPTLKEYKSSKEVLDDYAGSGFDIAPDASCIYPIQGPNGNWYPIASVPTVNDPANTLAKPYDADSKFIFKNLLECMASTGSSNCALEESLKCDDGTNAVKYWRVNLTDGKPSTKFINDYKNAKCL